MIAVIFPAKPMPARRPAAPKRQAFGPGYAAQVKLDEGLRRFLDCSQQTYVG
jgi:hypothetical protein